MRLVPACLLLAAAVCSCGGGGSLLPKSGGKPYEVLVVDAGGGRGAVAVVSVLSQAVPGLPQREPLFDVSLTDGRRFNATAKLARSIVIVNVDPGLFTATRIRYEKNVWARPQVVAYVNAASDSALLADVQRIGGKLVGLLTRAEVNAAVSRLGKYDSKASRTVGGMFGYDLRLPSDMKSSKRGREFVWYSNNAPTGMQNICVYSYPGRSLDPVRALSARDSVMKANIPGERGGMYMRTAAGTVASGTVEVNGRVLMVSRGLWEMRGDAMGGPFVSHSVVDSANGRIIVAEAFVYAPETNKRNLIRQLEAALYTMKKVKR